MAQIILSGELFEKDNDLELPLKNVEDNIDETANNALQRRADSFACLLEAFETLHPEL